jgi:hypothetical protein
MLTTLQLTPAQHHIRESLAKGASNADRISQHRFQVPRVRESLIRSPTDPARDRLHGRLQAVRRHGRGRWSLARDLSAEITILLGSSGSGMTTTQRTAADAARAASSTPTVRLP